MDLMREDQRFRFEFPWGFYDLYVKAIRVRRGTDRATCKDCGQSWAGTRTVHDAGVHALQYVHQVDVRVEHRFTVRTIKPRRRAQ